MAERLHASFVRQTVDADVVSSSSHASCAPARLVTSECE
jgi:hypothetical protein